MTFINSEVIGVVLITCSVCVRGDADICSLLVENGATVKVDASTGVSPLHIACVYKHASCVKILLCVSKCNICLFVCLSN